jgi:hypothetical protein
VSKLSSPARLGEQYKKSDLYKILTDIDNQVNNLSEGRVSASYNAVTAIPTSSVVSYARGDKVWKSNVTVQGTALSQYVVIGWVCTASGTPGTWVEMRTLTGT